MQAEAQAQPNIALVKYWGKRDAALNLPAVGSISITLDSLVTRTRVQFDEQLETDQVTLDGVTNVEEKNRIGRFVELFRELAGIHCFAYVNSANNFPTGAGLASSASGFAALAVACDAALSLKLDNRKLSELARRGSGSAARSLLGGFVEWHLGQEADGSDSVAKALRDSTSWPLQTIIAITSYDRKSVGSSRGMNLTMETSPFYSSWVENQSADLDVARSAIKNQDFESLAEVSEFSCLKMHASALAARPGLIYWNAASLACMQVIRQMRAQGNGVFFTIDAGPQVKAICLPETADSVAKTLAEVPGVEDVLRTGLGNGARVCTDKDAC
ncbi:MAG: diphosphomevalonate decarboxylase [Gammaproteobacteria bacterium]